ncbi:MAG: DUF4369 domain-containing protein [Firmicutes bacterium]|nr:DUF4369 domain-containing protein [Bacillota bacterium]MCM1401329.1 DUF4369 domain-containing protein [Bacteroides sp.]MCM1477282.1 DUF4369 domain-containing protein [Bacteroides sp.]
MKLTKYICGAAMAASLFACKGTPEWHVDGRIDGADGQTMYVEASDNGQWYVLDSITLDQSGNFSFASAAAGYPDIYRLRLNDKSVYFPIDSIETVTVVTKADAFDADYTLAGTPEAEQLMAVDRRVSSAMAGKGAAGLTTDSVLKRDLSNMLLENPSGIVSYYIINKRVGGVPLFNPANKNDLKVIGAVANAFNVYRPLDPRTNYLKQLFLGNKRSSAPADTLVATETTLIDIELMDRKGTKQSLQKIADKNKVVLLSFTSYGEEFSPGLNMELNKIYTKYHPSGLEIYQIGFDEQEFDWRKAASNLPWITVYNSSTDGVNALASYNVGAIPAMYLIENGEIRERLTDATRIEQTVAKYF